MIALNNPIKPNLLKLNKLLDKVNVSGHYTNFGPLHNELTEQLENYLGVENLLLTNNGTSALQIAGRAIGTKSILTTPFSFIATVSAFEWQKDEVAFSDIDPQSLNLSPESIKDAYNRGCNADTIVATHVYGNPCDVKIIDKLSDEYQLKVIYDAAHSFGVNIGKKSVLNYGDASTLSFHATKIFHTIEGGAVVFKDKANFDRAKEIINFGIRTGQGIVGLGINAKLNEYQAAVGLVNLEQIDDIINHRAELAFYYKNKLKNLIELPDWHSEANDNGAYMPVLFNSGRQMKYAFDYLAKSGIQSRNYFEPSLERVFPDNYNYGSKNSTSASQRVLCLPIHAHLTLKDVDSVVKVLEGILR